VVFGESVVVCPPPSGACTGAPARIRSTTPIWRIACRSRSFRTALSDAGRARGGASGETQCWSWRRLGRGDGGHPYLQRVSARLVKNRHPRSTDPSSRAPRAGADERDTYSVHRAGRRGQAATDRSRRPTSSSSTSRRHVSHPFGRSVSRRGASSSPAARPTASIRPPLTCATSFGASLSILGSTLRPRLAGTRSWRCRRGTAAPGSVNRGLPLANRCRHRLARDGRCLQGVLCRMAEPPLDCVGSKLARPCRPADARGLTRRRRAASRRVGDFVTTGLVPAALDQDASFKSLGVPLRRSRGYLVFPGDGCGHRPWPLSGDLHDATSGWPGRAAQRRGHAVPPWRPGFS